MKPLAAAVTAIPAVGPSKGAETGDNQVWRDLWHRFIDAEIKFGAVLHALSKAQEQNRELEEFEAAEEEASDVATEALLDIARTPVDGPLSIAVKLAAIAHDEELDARRVAKAKLEHEGRHDIIDNVMLCSVYMWAAAQCGYDPLMEAYQALHHPALRRESGWPGWYGVETGA
jgi:hypothetical protein